MANRVRLLVVLAALAGGAVLAFVLLAGVSLSVFDFGRSETRYRESPAVLQSLRDLSRYHAASGDYQIIVDVEEDVRFVPSFVAGERTMMVATGSVDAAVDFSGLGPAAVEVSEDRTTVSITLPAPELTEAHIDNEHTYVAERQRGLFDRVGEFLSSNPGDDAQLYVHAEAQLAEAAAQSELLVRAKANTRAMLTSLLEALGFESVTIRFDAPAPAPAQ